MNEDIRIISMFNVLILQLVFLSLSAKMSMLDWSSFMKIWYAFKIQFFAKAKKKTGKRQQKFWEIDMTKFKL